MNRSHSLANPLQSILLLKAVLNGDAKEVEALMGNGTALSAEQVVSFEVVSRCLSLLIYFTYPRSPH